MSKTKGMEYTLTLKCVWWSLLLATTIAFAAGAGVRLVAGVVVVAEIAHSVVVVCVAWIVDALEAVPD